jgi:PHP family Zn ribbon phosphoesterase
MLVKAQLHVHSTLSACCDKENTLNNIVNMCALLGVKILALSDHNSCRNFLTLEKLCKQKGILAVPATEVTTAEEIHVLCLFNNYDDVRVLCEDIYASQLKVKTNLNIYNAQNVLDEFDNITETEPYLLSVASSYGIYELFDRVKQLDGLAIPAHVDRETNSIISVLGAIPDDLDIRCVEITPCCDEELKQKLKNKYNVIVSSDAHCLEELCKTDDFYIDLEEISTTALIKRLKL